MLSRWLAARFGRPGERVERLGLFVVLGTVLVGAVVLARTVAESLFLARAGARAIPLYFLLLGLFSAPVAALFARLIDRRPRLLLLRDFLLGSALLALALRLLLGGEQTWPAFASLILLVLVEMLLYIQFWVLVADHFTSLEQKRLVPGLSAAMALGGMLGGLLVQALAPAIGARNLLLVLPGLYLVAVLLVAELRRSHRPLEVGEPYFETGLWQTLSELRGLVKRFPVVGWLAATGFAEVFLGGLAGFLIYGIYEASFADEEQLASFLGTLNALLSLAEIPLTWFLTRPLIRRLGVGRMGLFFPITTLATYFGLLLSFRLPMAVATHFNLDPVAKSVAQPIETLTYNAVPSRFLGRVRTLSGGWIQPSGMAASGLFLIAVQDRLQPPVLVLTGLLLSLGFILLGVRRARSYHRSLASQLREGTLDLTAVADGLRHLPRQQLQQVAGLIAGADPKGRRLGLELAARSGSRTLLAVVWPQLPRLEKRETRLVVHYLTAFDGGADELLRRLDAALGQDLRPQRLLLEALIARRTALGPERLQTLADSPDAVVRSLARVADLLETPEELALRAPPPAPSDDEAALAVTRIAASRRDPRLGPLLEALLERRAIEVRRAALEALALLVTPPSERALRLSSAPLQHDDPRLRAAAIDLLARAGPEAIPPLARRLEDRAALVRQRAAEVLGDFGEQAVPQLRRALDASRQEVRTAAIVALGRVPTRHAEVVLFDFLQRDQQLAARYARWLAAVPDDPRWRPLRVALEDATRRVLDLALEVLAALGYTRTLDAVRRVLQGADVRQRANAVETLDSLPHRRFVRPLLDLLETLVQKPPAIAPPVAAEPPLEEIALAPDRWVCVGAISVLRTLGRPLPSVLDADADALVRGFTASNRPEEDLMNRLLLLKRVSLFEEMSLDHLLALDGALRPVEYLAGETVFEQGDLGEDFYIVERGQISIRAELGGEVRELNRLREGDTFGEMALFDDALRSASAVAATACTLLVLDRRRFHSLFDQLPRFGIEISRVLSVRLRRLQDRFDRTLDRVRDGEDPSSTDLLRDLPDWEGERPEEER